MNDSVCDFPLADSVPPPTPVRRKLDQLAGQRDGLAHERDEKMKRLAAKAQYLGIADAVEDALDKLSEAMFGQLVRIIKEKLTIALQEVLEQPIALNVEREFKRGTATMSFEIVRDGKSEDILRGQGGSVANVLSVGLRLLALTRLDAKTHWRFLVLDEQDCWLRPDLVPRLARIVHVAAKELGFQVVMISHHEVGAFERHADRIHRFTPTPDGVWVQAVHEVPSADVE